MHPVANIRGSASNHLAGRRVVLGVCGSIAAVKAVELARELVRHGADVVPVMTDAAAHIVHPDALEFATGNKPILRLTGAVEHVALLGEVAGKADLLLVAPATANTVSKMALGIDDSPVTTCATVAFGTRTPVVVAPAMHEAMLRHPIVAQHQQTLVSKMGVEWVEPLREERKAKLADVEAIVEAVIHRLAIAKSGPLAGKRCLVVSGSTAEPIDPIRAIGNLSSGRTGHLIATELRRLGADVMLWQGHATAELPSPLADFTQRFSTHAGLMRAVKATDLSGIDQVWMPAAIGDFAPVPARGKIGSDEGEFTLRLKPLPKVIEAIRAKAPDALLVAFKAETDAKSLLSRAKSRLKRYKADFVAANTHDSFGSDSTALHLVSPKGSKKFSGPKAAVLPQVVAEVAASARPARPAAKPRIARSARRDAPRSAKGAKRAKPVPSRLSRPSRSGGSAGSAKSVVRSGSKSKVRRK